MKYFVLLAAYGELQPWDELTAEEQDAQMAQLGAFDEACAARPGVEILSEAPLGDGSMATTLRTRGGEMTITDGPFAEAAEQICGYYLSEAFARASGRWPTQGVPANPAGWLYATAYRYVVGQLLP